MRPTRTVHLVSCVKVKQPSTAPAKELYQSPWFRKARAHAEAAGALWYILSAKFELLHPDRVIKPYDETLNDFSASERRAWADRVCAAFAREVGHCDEIVILAGRRYVEFVVPCLRRFANRVLLPLEGLRLGEQLAWFDRQAEIRKARARKS